MHSFLHCIFVTGEKIDTFMYNPTNICWKPCHSLHKEYIINSNKYRKRDHHFVIIRFTDFYNSQCIMHFTATLIRIRTNISIIENIMFVQVSTQDKNKYLMVVVLLCLIEFLLFTQSMKMILPHVHLRKPCYDFSFL